MPPDLPHVVTVTPAEAMQSAIARHRGGALDEAEAIYTQVLQLEPRRPDALNFMGMLQFQRGEFERALTLLKQASQVAPREPAVWNNLGNVLANLSRYADAEKAFLRSLALVENPEALGNLSRMQRRRRAWTRAEKSARRALALAPEFGEGWHYLSLALVGQGRMEEAFEAATRAELLLPAKSRNKQAYGRALLLAGERERAAAYYRDWLAAEPDNAYVRHHLAATLGELPERASDAYVEEMFDGFAGNFDVHLASLGYCAPELVEAALRAVLPPPAAQLDIADLGCGTGLCGPLFKPWARRLVGCDLSAGMLGRAERRQVYDELAKAELVRFMADRPGAFDVLLSADTLIYFGDLAPVFAAAHAALRPEGWLAFTLEALPDGDVADQRLTDSGRYAHALPGLRRRLAEAGFAGVAIEAVSPRVEGGQPVAGWLVTARRLARAGSGCEGA